MRYAALLLVPIVVSAQPAASDQKLTEVLIAEVQQLRLAIERSTLLSARTQLAVSQLQLQETTVARLTQQYNEIRSGSAVVSTQRNQLAEKVKDLEVRRTTAEASARGIYELQFQQAKLDLEQATAADQERSARQAELASELNQARSGMADARSRIAELERALDAAIQQLVKQK